MMKIDLCFILCMYFIFWLFYEYKQLHINYHFEKYLQKTNDKMAISLIKMFKLGPDVSLSGSPTVSPITAALWIYEPLLTIFP